MLWLRKISKKIVTKTKTKTKTVRNVYIRKKEARQLQFACLPQPQIDYLMYRLDYQEKY